MSRENRFEESQWALILGGSSGFGLATARRLSADGMSVCVVHRDRRGAMDRIDREFEAIRQNRRGFLSLNLDALSPEGQTQALDALAAQLGDRGRVRTLLHSIAFGNLKPLAPVAPDRQTRRQLALARLASKLQVAPSVLQQSIEELLSDGASALHGLSSADHGETLIEEEDLSRTIHSMGTSLVGWVQALFARGLFAADARVFGLTSEGRDVSWPGYAAVAAAKAALESVCRAISVEYGPYGIRCNILQPGVTDTPALRLIPGHLAMKASAEMRNPLGRLTRPEDVAQVISLLSSDDAAWVNGTMIHVDGGEHNAC